MPLPLLVLLCTSATAPDAGVAAPPSEPTVTGGVEVVALALPSTGAPGGLDGYAAVTPLLGVHLGSRLEAELGPTLRLRLLDAPPLERPGDVGGLLRGADWDSPSDFGALVRSLRVGGDASPARLELGALSGATLGLGHLVRRFGNQDDPDSHPAGARASLELGPVRAEALASDVLAARVFALELAWDAGRSLSTNAQAWDRFFLAGSVGVDAASGPLPFGCRAGPCVDAARSLGTTLLQLDLSAVLVRNRSFRLLLEGGGGARANAAFDAGLVGGLVADVELGEVALSARLEVRSQQGGFRPGYFGPLYDLARWSDTGFHEAPRARAVLPEGVSFDGELRARVGRAVSVAVAVETFAGGRVDVDGSATLELVGSRLFATARVATQGLFVAPRTFVQAEARLRLLPSLYAVAGGGTVFLVQPDGTLWRGVTASLGAGLDFAG